jgi:molecular chaperone DnaJ
VEISVEKHPILIRNEIHLMYDLEISLPCLILGTKVEIPTLEGSVKINVKPHSKPGEILRLLGKGLSDQRGNKGDQLITLKVHVPEKLTKEEKKLLEELAMMPNFKIR